MVVVLKSMSDLSRTAVSSMAERRERTSFLSSFVTVLFLYNGPVVDTRVFLVARMKSRSWSVVASGGALPLGDWGEGMVAAGGRRWLERSSAGMGESREND